MFVFKRPDSWKTLLLVNWFKMFNDYSKFTQKTIVEFADLATYLLILYNIVITVAHILHIELLAMQFRLI